MVALREGGCVHNMLIIANVAVRGKMHAQFWVSWSDCEDTPGRPLEFAMILYIHIYIYMYMYIYCQ